MQDNGKSLSEHLNEIELAVRNGEHDIAAGLMRALDSQLRQIFDKGIKEGDPLIFELQNLQDKIQLLSNTLSDERSKTASELAKMHGNKKKINAYKQT
ncbi:MULTISPECIES: hypothetical protein [Pseudoalteromonas]|uniref:Uncharacterized protein n=1 Tax=Pseudoalteromonas amylolytica TaxID=1859457 RepID=A0A1S1MQG6_9GAMM|nr:MULTISPECIES: hypothetical protein [Pseudoalteromonas]OHU87552.1 hypothetical protein BFC16_08860 [Pseudoalteromonas sp. JW3]OHU90995.1 hypothetical protein BET10_08975 [Pseudoalteromonas amylolytica]